LGFETFKSHGSEKSGKLPLGQGPYGQGLPPVRKQSSGFSVFWSVDMVGG